MNLDQIRQVLKKFLRRESAQPFAEPVPLDLAPGYADAIARPMDLGTVLAALQADRYSSLGAWPMLSGPARLAYELIAGAYIL